MGVQVEIEELVRFLSRANVVDTATAVFVSQAFTSVATSLVSDVLLPFLDVAIPKTVQERQFWVLTSGDSGKRSYETASAALDDNAVVVTYGKVARAFIIFFLQGFCLFLVFRLLSKTKHLPGFAGELGAQLDSALPTDRA